MTTVLKINYTKGNNKTNHCLRYILYWLQENQSKIQDSETAGVLRYSVIGQKIFSQKPQNTTKGWTISHGAQTIL